MKEKATKINIVCKNKRVITVQILAIILSIVKTLYRNALTVICNALQINFGVQILLENLKLTTLGQPRINIVLRFDKSLHHRGILKNTIDLNKAGEC